MYILFLFRTILTILLFCVAYVGDYLISINIRPISKAIADSITHGAIGGLTWYLLSFGYRTKIKDPTLYAEVIICFTVSSGIDVDHFIAAKSWDINDATHLHKRPFLHSSTLWFLIGFVYLISLYNGYERIHTFSWILFTAFFSHHIRDGTRRGLWFWPFGSTNPIPYWWYISIILCTPYIIHILDTYLKHIKPLVQSQMHQFTVLEV